MELRRSRLSLSLAQMCVLGKGGTIGRRSRLSRPRLCIGVYVKIPLNILAPPTPVSSMLENLEGFHAQDW